MAATTDARAVELGIKFRSDTPGVIKGIRFYKGRTNTGTHVATLWDIRGKKLATATFTNETATGWQQVNFAIPVAIIANTTYVASYLAPRGHYSVTQRYFANRGVDNPPLQALASGVSPNGVFKYGGGFPTATSNSTNYWVDVDFDTITTPDTTPPTVITFTVPATATALNVPITSLTATDDVAVAAYLVKESSGTPPAASSGWTATAPTSYAFGSAGSKTLYAWAKDAAGNVSASRSASVNITLPDMANAVISFAASQLLDTADQLQPGNYPRSSLPDGTWRTEDTRGWTSGFFEGLMWKMYEHTGDQDWATLARSWSAPQTENQFNTGTHDIGFQLMRSFGDGYRLTGDPGYRKALLNGAGSLARRFNPAVGSIKSWDWADWWEYPVIIDNMMNLELLFFAAELDGGDARWNQIAHQHALTTMRDHVRPDGSTYHVVNYNPDTGAVLSRETWQGADDDSTWARGQAWAIHGFTTAYRYTDDPRLLATAERVADYFIAHLPSDGIPYWDFQAPGIPRTNRDSSAAAIAASGLEELKDYVSPVKAEEYRGIATQILQTLSSSDYLAEGSNSPGIVLHGVGSFPAGTEVDVSLIYGDYYFIEALLRDRGEGL